MAASIAVLAVRARDHEIALEANRVVRVVASADWDGPRPVDLEQLVLDVAPDASCRHVLVVRSDGEDWQVGTTRDLVMRELVASEIYAVPTLLWPSRERAMFLGVVNLPDSPPLLLLDLAVLRARATAPNRQGDIG